MTIYKTAYDTTACSGYRLKDFETKLRAAYISASFHLKHIKLDQRDEFFHLYLVEGGNIAADTIPYFGHPIALKPDSKSVDSEEIFVDVRNFGRWNPHQGTFNVNNKPEYRWAIIRSVLNKIWLNARPETFRDISILPMSVYTSLISESITRRADLDPGEQLIISAVAGLFYLSLFTNEKEFSELELIKHAGTISRATKIPADKVSSIISDLKPIKNLEEFCEICKEKTQSIRLQEFNTGILVTIATGAWFGNNAKENLAVGLEHPPTWMMIIYSALSEATFKRSILAKIVERHNKGDLGNSYIKSINMLLGGEKSVEEMVS